jgi:ElaB/YqjD/DUF883 family membrane-anchored ribosome-binding protein
MTEMEAKKELHKLLSQKPHLREFQSKLDKMLNNVGKDPIKRLQLINGMMQENLDKLTEAFEQIKKEAKNV